MRSSKKIYFVTGGGTGGHIYPAVSVAKALLQKDDTEKVYYVGNPKNLEARIAQEENLDFLPINISSMPRKLNFDFLKWGFKLDKATWKALFYIYKYKPNAVFGTGGYVSAPLIIASMISNTPYVIHDSDAHPGIVSRYSAKLAKHVSLSFEEAKKFIDNKNVSINGNPIKPAFFTVSKDVAKKELGFDNKRNTLFVMGGSQGAMNINHTVCSCLKYFAEDLKINVIMQTGVKNYDSTIDLLKQIYPDYSKKETIIVQPYFSDMTIPMNAADLVIARSGSLSLSEIAAVGVPSILVPFPYAAADHQRKNAKCYENAGASIYIDDFELNKEKLEYIVTELVKNQEKLVQMSESVLNFSRPNALKDIVDKIISVAK